MGVPTALRLLEAWEGAASAPAWERPLWLLGAAECDLKEAAGLALGERDERLLQLWEAVFGPELNGVTVCPRCGDRLELKLATSDLRSSYGEAENPPFDLCVDEFAVRFRLPNTQDLAAGSGCRTEEEARRLIFQRCVLAMEQRETAMPVEAAPEEVVELVARRMSEADPLADSELTLCCPGCDHRWTVPFDVGSFVWTEFNVWAQKRLEEVHLLASAYGWSEAAILELSPVRRRYYVEAVCR